MPFFRRVGISDDSARVDPHTTIHFPAIRALHIALAPIEEQQEIVRRIRGALAVLRSQEEAVEQGLARLDRLDQAILARAFLGELVPQDPNDEPASVLLERIREERAREEKPRRGSKAPKTGT
jgi:type I restriction enzyme S subunit